MAGIPVGPLGGIYVDGLLSGRNEPMEASSFAGDNDNRGAGIFAFYRMENRVVFVRDVFFFFFFFQFLVIAVIQRQLGHIFKTAFALAVYDEHYRFGGNFSRRGRD